MLIKKWMLKAAVSSQISAWADFIMSYVAYNFWAVDGAFSAAIGAVSGGIVNCTVNYKWTFRSSDSGPFCVAVKYALVWVGSLLLNSFGTKVALDALEGSALTEAYGLPDNITFTIARLGTSLAVSLFWNLYLQRVFVYRKVPFDSFITHIADHPLRDR